MTRIIVKGWYYDGHAEPGSVFQKGWAMLDGRRLVATGKASTNPPKGKIINGIVLPALPNAHTHLADFRLRSKVRPGMSVEELVAPPNGLKHKLLPKIDVAESIGEALRAMAAAGIGPFCDFREGGAAGVEAMASAVVTSGKGLNATILGRPLGLSFDKEETDAILSKCDGIGVSALRDWDPQELSALSAHVRRKGKVFAMHASETVREDIDALLDLCPKFLVHMVKGTKGDFHRLSVMGVPVVVCPSSNKFFGLRPPIEDMLGSGVQVCIGTDNAMLGDISMLSELRAVRDLGINATAAWGLVESSWKLLNRKDILHNDDPDTRWIMIETVTDKPYEALTGTGQSIIVKGV